MLRQIIDYSPIMYLFALAIVLKSLGTHVSLRYPRVAFFQYASGVTVFGALALRRLVVDPPWELASILDALIRAGSFGMIAFGIVGGCGTVVLLLQESLGWLKNLRENHRQKRETRQRLQEEAENRRQRAASAPSYADRERERRLQQEASDRQKALQTEDEKRRAADLAKRKTLRMQCQLETHAVLEKDRRQSIREFIDTYLEDDLSLDEYEHRRSIIQEHIARESAGKKKEGYESITEIETDFARQLDEVDSLSLSRAEKESLGAYIQMEKNNAIRNFLQR